MGQEEINPLYPRQSVGEDSIDGEATIPSRSVEKVFGDE